MTGADDRDPIAFLGDHAPFHAMPGEALAELAAAATQVRFATGELIADFVTDPPDEIWVVRSGQALLLADRESTGDPLDAVGPGGLFGYGPMLSPGKVSFVARAAERSVLIRLPGSLMRGVFGSAAGVSFLAAKAWDTVVTRSPRDRGSLVAVRALIPRAPLIVEDRTPIGEVVRRMTEEHTSYALIVGRGPGTGIFTDRDLRTRVVAAGVGLSVPIGEVMSSPVRSVPPDRIGATVLMDMLESGLRHMVVLDRWGRAIGVVEERDLVATSTRQSFVVRRAIALAADADELSAATDRVTDLAVNLFRGGTDALGTSAVLSVMIDAIVRRAVDIELASRPDAWTRQFSWLSLGSIARREAMPSSDVDSAIAWSDDADIDVAALRAMATAVHGTLDRCGLPADSNGAVAFAPRFSRSASQWAAAAAGWAADPMHDRGLIMSSLLLDGRVVRGDPTLNPVPAAFARMPLEHPNTLRLQMLDALSGRPRVRSVLDVVARRGGTFDLKAHALTPIVNLARWAGLTVGVGPASTVDRLALAAGRGILSEGDAQLLREIFELVQRLRMTHQIDQLAVGADPGDVVTLGDLSPLSRSLLNDGMREVVTVQRRVRAAALQRAAGIAPEAPHRPARG